MSAMRRSVLLSMLLLAATAPPLAAAGRAGPQADVSVAAIAGEFALQAGRLTEASQWYLRAARVADGDAGLAERALRIALLAKDDASAAQALALWRRRAADSSAMRGAQATLALRRGRARAARRNLEVLLRSPDQRDWHHALVALGGVGRDRHLPARLLGELVDAGAIPDRLPAWLAFAGLAQRLGEQVLAERMVGEVVRRFPDEPRVGLLHAGQLRAAGRDVQARAVLDGLARRRIGDDEIRLALAAEYDALGDPLAAAATLAGAERSDRGDALRAALLAKAKSDVELAALYDELKARSAAPEPSRRLLLGQIAEYLKRFDQALDWYRSVPGGDARWQARLREANVLHELGRAAAAFDALHRVQADASADQSVRRDAYLLEAELHGKGGQAGAEELQAYARGLAAFPDDSGLLYARALSWERRDDIPRAEADLRRILAAEPENVAALNALGYTLADRTQRYQEALELLNRARAAEPDNPAIIDSYGWVLYRLGRSEEALTELQRAFGLHEDAEIAAHVGEVLWTLGRKDEARRYFERARKLEPESRALERALRSTGA